MEAAMEDGTQSILDLFRVGSVPGFGTVCPLGDEQLVRLFGTAKPTRELVEKALIEGKPDSARPAIEQFWEHIDRGQGRYIVIYSGSEPREILFVGYSFD